ncbi:MAG: alpha/beta hydrolase [Anaerolineae bacterium]|nr:alpha/beta hydrolase [Anaerolineae bacterium]
MKLTHRVRRSNLSGQPAPLLIMLHGFGSNESDLLGLAPYLDPRFTIVSVRAPYSLGYNSYAWFELQFSPLGQVIGRDMQQAELSRATLGEFIGEATQAYNADPKQVYLMGFSQGAMMSAYVALTQPDLLAGAVLMSGSVLPEWQPAPAAALTLKNLPMLVVHGIEDAILPIEHGRNSRAKLSALGVPLEYHEYDMAHTISEESLSDIDVWLTNRLADSG